jgi:hypothetical protein
MSGAKKGLRLAALVAVIVVGVGARAGTARADFLRVIDPSQIPNATARSFGNVQLGGSATATITLQSCSGQMSVPDSGNCPGGDGDNTITAFSFGAGCGEFSYTNNVQLPTVIFYSGLKTFNFRYTPTARGSDSCVVTTVPPGGGTDTPASFTLTGGGIAPELVIDPSPVAFGSTPVGTPVSASITLRNPGENSLNIGSLAISGANAGDFAFTNQGCAGDNPCNANSGLQTTQLMANGGAAVFTLSCTPSASGARTATLTVTTNDPVSPNETAQLTCTGTVPQLSLSATVKDFGNQRIGTTSAPFTITVSNTGGASLTYSVSSPDAQFVLACPQADPTCLDRTLAAGATTTFDVAFAAMFGGNQNTALTVDSNDPQQGAVAVAVSGSGVASQVDALPLDFGSVTVGSSSTASVVVTNTGSATLTIANVAPLTALGITGGGGQFAIVLPAGNPACDGVQSCARTIGPLAVNGTTSIPIRCTPTGPGEQIGNLVIASDSINSPFSVPLRCVGVVPDVSVSTMAVAFANQRLGTTSAAQTFTVDNAGSAPMTYTISESSGDFALSCAPNACNGTLASGGRVTVSATFAPTSAGAKMANVTIATPGDPDEMSTLVMMTGTGVEPIVTVEAPSPAPLAIGNVDVGTSAIGTVTLRNTGTADLSITSVTLVGGDAAQFAITNGTVGAQTLPSFVGASTRSWTVTCTPTSIGAKTATFRVVHDAPSAGSQTNIAVTCTGRAASFVASVVAPAVIDFGQVQVGMPSAAQTFTFTNNGNKPGRIMMLTSSANVFAPTTMANLANDIAAGGSITVSVVFTPADSSVVSGQVCAINNGLASPVCASVTGDGASVGIDVLPAPDFGAVRFDAAPVTSADITIRNTGESALRLDSITSAGAPFTIVSAPALPANLALNDTRTFKVRLTPTSALGTVTRNITVGGVFTVSGTAATATVQATARIVAPQVAMSADTVEFGTFDIDDPGTQVTRTAAIMNTSDAATGSDLHLGLPVLDSGAPDFALINPAAVTLSPTWTGLVTIGFDPSTAGAKTGQVTIPIDALTGMTYTLTLRGQAIDQNAMCSPATIMFPVTVRGESSAAIDARLTNLDFATGQGTAAPLTYTAAITGADAGDFSLPAADAAGTIAGNASKDFPITFTPTAAGAGRTATLEIHYVDGGNRTCMVTLTGDGRLLELQVAPGSLDFGTVAIGSTVQLSTVASPLTVTNGEAAGAAATTISAVRLRGAGAAAFAVVGGEQPRDVAGGATVTYDLSFTPPDEGVFEADVDVFVGDDDTARYSVHVRGQGAPLVRGNPYSCGAGGSSSGGLLLLAIVLAGLRRRGGRRATAGG